MPGHTRSVLAAYPGLGCPNHKVAERYCWQDWGICEDFVCAGNDDVMRFYRDVIDEVCEMFPSRYIHLGGDECTGGSWRKCPKCQERMRALGCTDVMRLHGWMTEQLAGHVCSKGRVYMGYDDGVRNGAKLDSRQTVLICSNAAFGAMYAARGFKVVMAPLEYCFWDFHQNIPSDRNVY
ncbi:MAG: family 20 glycosylhydrolase, partial [Victivallales bacterium]|nr:family 20 glycosylhydrolase [Victivallales bacterium]